MFEPFRKKLDTMSHKKLLNTCYQSITFQSNNAQLRLCQQLSNGLLVLMHTSEDIHVRN
jgi:hypothetical protein